MMARTPDDDLLQSYLDGELTAPQAAALEARLLREPPLADLLITLSREETIVSEWAKADVISAAMDRQPAAALPTPRHRVRRWLAAGILVAGTAALVAIVTLADFLPTPPPAGPVYAQLEDVQGDVYVVSENGGQGVIAQSGQALRQGQTIRTGEGSFAVVAFPDSGKIEVSTDTTIRLLDSPIEVADQGMQVFLEAGTVAADSRRSPQRPMVLSTPHAETRLAESRASISSAARGTRIEQERGQVQVKRKGDSQPMAIPAGWFALAPANASEQLAKQPMPPPLNQARLVLREGVVAPQTLAYTPDGKTLAAGCGEGTVKFWDLTANGLPLPALKAGGKAPVRGLAYSPDGVFLAAVGDDRQVKLFDGALQATGVLKGSRLAVYSLAFARDGGLIATGGGNRGAGEVKIWSAAARIDLATLAGHTSIVTAVAFSPDSRLLATASRDGTVKVWDITTRELRHTLLGHSGPVNTVAFTPDGTALASGGKDQTVKFWDVVTGVEQRTFQQGLVGEVRSLAFSPDGKVLAVADQNVQMLDVTTGRQLLVLKGHKNAISCVTFAPNGREVATAGFDRTVRVWDVPVLGR